VKDTVAGFISIYDSELTIGEEINIATQSEISIGNLAKSIFQLMGKDPNIITEQERLRPKKSEVQRLYGSNEKILRLTDWVQKYSLEEGLQETINWFQQPSNINKYKTDIYNI
ncbi:MAG: NAD-dependent dehydratase, partial [Candidatus Methanofastidiosa archaeon]|nr:NAD-dependent dehydratase [Candidatus Methanofastidiosa archaeon]